MLLIRAGEMLKQTERWVALFMVEINIKTSYIYSAAGKFVNPLEFSIFLHKYFYISAKT